MDPELIAKNETVPLLQINLELVAPDIQWQPEIGQLSDGSGVRDQFNRCNPEP